MGNVKNIREELSALLDGELEPSARAEIEAALAADPDALREFEDFSRVSALYRELARVSAPADLETRLHAAIQPRRLRLSARRLAVRRVWPLAAAAALLVCIAVPFWRAALHAPERMRVSKLTWEKGDAMPLETAGSEAGTQRRGGKQMPLSETGTVPSERVPEQDGTVPVLPGRAARVAPAPPPPAAAPVVAISANAGTSAAASKAIPPPVMAEQPPVAERVVPELQREALSPPPGLSAFRSDLERQPPKTSGKREETSLMPPGPAAQSAPASAKTEAGHIAFEAAPLPHTGDGPTRAAGTAGAKARREPQEGMVRVVAGRTFILTQGVWRQEDYAGEKATPLFRESDHFTTLTELHPEIREFAALGPRVIFALNDLWYDLQSPAG